MRSRLRLSFLNLLQSYGELESNDEGSGFKHGCEHRSCSVMWIGEDKIETIGLALILCFLNMLYSRYLVWQGVNTAVSTSPIDPEALKLLVGSP